MWTAAAVLAGYAYAWLNKPELLTWWKRTSTGLIEWMCGLLPYPWSDRVEATLGNFGLWVQITSAIIAFRIVVWLLAGLVKWSWSPPAKRRKPVKRDTGIVNNP